MSGCAQVPYKGVFTDNQYEIKDFRLSPVLIFHQQDLPNPTMWEYAKIANRKLQSHKIFIFLINEITEAEKKILTDNIASIDGFILANPLPLTFETGSITNKIILNSGIIDLETDDYHLSPTSKRSYRFENENNKYLFTNNVEKISTVKDERSFRFYLEDPLLGILKIRKSERKNITLNYLIMSNKKTEQLIRSRSHEFLNFKFIPEPLPGFFTLGENTLELCKEFFRATMDCYSFENGLFSLDKKMIDQRNQILKADQEKTKAQFLGEEILPAN